MVNLVAAGVEDISVCRLLLILVIISVEIAGIPRT